MRIKYECKNFIVDVELYPIEIESREGYSFNKSRETRETDNLWLR